MSHPLTPSEVERVAKKVVERIPPTSIVTVIEDAYTSIIIRDLKKRGTPVYRISSGDMRVITPTNSAHSLKGVWPGNPATADVLVSACTFYNSMGGVYIRSARTARFISGLKRRGFFNLKSLLQIGIASPAQRCDKYDVRSKYAFTANIIIGSDVDLSLRKQHGNVVSPENFFRLLLRGYPPDRIPDIEDARSECYGKTKQIIDEEFGAVDAQELGIDQNENPNQESHP